MLIFPKPFKVPALYLVWVFPRTFAFHVCSHAPGLGQRSLSRMMLMLNYLVKVYFDSFEFLVCTWLGSSLEHWLLFCATMPLVRP